MGRDQRLNEEAMRRGRQIMERQMGPVMRHGVYDSRGCPKCGAPGEVLKKKYHPGYLELAPEDHCAVPAEHLHGVCPGCGFEWREQVRDCDDSDRRLPCAQEGDTAEVVEGKTTRGTLAVLPAVDA